MSPYILKIGLYIIIINKKYTKPNTGGYPQGPFLYYVRTQGWAGGPEIGNFPLLYVVKMSLRRWVGGSGRYKYTGQTWFKGVLGILSRGHLSYDPLIWSKVISMSSTASVLRECNYLISKLRLPYKYRSHFRHCAVFARFSV